MQCCFYFSCCFYVGGRRLCAVGVHSVRPCKCAVSDVRLSVMIIVSEFTSGNVARVQGHAAVARRRRLCAVGAAFRRPFDSSAIS